MNPSSNHQLFASKNRVSQSLCNDRCQNILYKAVFEHFKEIKWIAAFLLASKSFQNSSFGANFFGNFAVDEKTIDLLESVLSPSSCLPLQFAPSLYIKLSEVDFIAKNSAYVAAMISATVFDEYATPNPDYVPQETVQETVNRRLSNVVVELVKTKHLHSSLRSLTFHEARNDAVSLFFTSSSNSWPQLQHLTLDCCGLDDSILEIIAKNAPQLRTLNLPKNNWIMDAGLESISKLSHVTFLNLYNCSCVSDEGLEHLSKLSGLASLFLFNCNYITDAGLEQISKIKSLTKLDLSECDKITDDGIESLSKLSNITMLNISYCNRITDVGLEHLSKLPNITSLNLNWCVKCTKAGQEKFESVTNGNIVEFTF